MSEWQVIEYPHLGIRINAALNRPSKEIEENVRINCKRGLEQIWPHEKQDTIVSICAGGPSLDYKEVGESQERGNKIVALAGAANYLLRNGVEPDCHILLDSRIGNLNFLTNSNCMYLVASQCDPKVFDALKNNRVLIWHSINNSEEAKAINENYDAWIPVSGGNTIALRSLRLLQILGFWRFELFGVDSCMLEGKHHAYDQQEADGQETTTIGLNGKPFTVTAWQIQQAMEFIKMTKTFLQDCEIISHGPGLISEMIRGG